jgi:hypothetical protein
MIRHSRKDKIMKGNLLFGSVEDKLDQIEQKLIIMNRRNASYVIGMAPRIPMSSYVNEPEQETGIILRMLIPGDGIITSGYMFIEDFDKKANSQVAITVASPASESTINIGIDKAITAMRPNTPVSAGQRLSIAITPIDSCKKIWVGFMLELANDNVKKDYEMADKFMQLIDQADEDLTDA